MSFLCLLFMLNYSDEFVSFEVRLCSVCVPENNTVKAALKQSIDRAPVLFEIEGLTRCCCERRGCELAVLLSLYFVHISHLFCAVYAVKQGLSAFCICQDVFSQH